MRNKTILGIDPGSTLVGYGLITETKDGLKPLQYGALKISATTLAAKLKILSTEIATLLEKTKPELVGIEKLFFSKNRKTALEVAQARGAIIAELMRQNIPMLEFTPGEVKVAVTNYGSSDKLMVRKMVVKILNLPDFTGDDNVSDALAIAITAANASRSYTQGN